MRGMNKPAPARIQSKLPHVGTTIFTVMSQLAAEHGAINLSQGFPDYDGPAALKESVKRHIDGGFNQYPPMAGVQPLREAVAAKVLECYGARVSPDTEVTITPGATEAIYCAVTAVVRSGDEVILFDPAYDSYEPAILLAGGVPVRLPLAPPAYGIDWERVRDAITPRTRMIMINSPHNPTGAVLSAADMATLAELAERHDLIVCSDEVYEHLIFDGRVHESVLRHPALAARAFAISSFGKTYHVTGWKTGYCVAPPALTTELRRVHQFVTFVGITPIQLGLAEFMRDHPGHLRELPAFYQAKRDLFNAALAGSRFGLRPSAGTYFQLADYSALSDLPDVEFARWLTTEVGVAAIPVSVFHASPPAARYVRFCFCKNDDTLRAAAARLRAL
jgi:methionine aminotransferase